MGLLKCGMSGLLLLGGAAARAPVHLVRLDICAPLQFSVSCDKLDKHLLPQLGPTRWAELAGACGLLPISQQDLLGLASWPLIPELTFGLPNPIAVAPAVASTLAKL